MTAKPFDKPPASRPSPGASPDWPAKWTPNGDSKERALAHLLRHGVLSHALGQDFEYKVRTTIVTQRAWQYRCDVVRHGKAMKRAFCPIIVDRTSHMQHIGTEPEDAEAMRLSLAKEAIEVHFTRCAVLREYLLLASIYFLPPPESRRRYTRLVLLVGMALLTAYGFWAHTLRTDSGQPPGNRPPAVQGALHPVADRGPATAPKPAPLPSSGSITSDDITDKPAGAPDVTPPAQTPKTLHLSDLIALEGPPERGKHALRAPTPQVSPGSMGSDVQEGDLLFLTGWIRRVSRAPDGTYYLQVSPSPKAGAPGLIAVVPPPDRAADSPAVQAQLQTVQAFITRRLLRQEKPSPRGSVIQNPAFVQLTGQLSHLGTSLGEPPPGKRSQEATARWEVRPVLEVQFAAPPVSSGRSRRK